MRSMTWSRATAIAGLVVVKRLHPAEFGSFVAIVNRPAAISTGELRRAHDDRPSSDHRSCRRHDYQNFITLGATQDFFLPRRLDYSA